MKRPPTSHRGFTSGQVVAGIVIVSIVAVVLIGMALQERMICTDRSKLAKFGANGAALARAWIRMTVDYEHVGWPGDLPRRDEAAKLATAKDFYARLLEYGALSLDDLNPLISAPTLKRWDGRSVNSLDPKTMTPFKIYNVSSTDGPDTIFLASRNYTYNQELPEKPLFGEPGFVIVNKTGNFSAYKTRQAQHLSLIGRLPGRTDASDRPIEGPADFLPMR